MEGRIAVHTDVRLRAVLADAEIVGADDISVARCTTDA